MKNARKIRMKMVGGVAAAAALGVGATGQAGGGVTPREGRAVIEGSFEGDVHEGRGPRRAPRLSMDDLQTDVGRKPSLTVRMLGNEEIDPQAVLPLAQDLDKAVRLAGGAPGSLAVIEIGRMRHTLDRRTSGVAGGAVISGFFGEDGTFEVELPAELDLRGLAARGAAIEDRLVSVVVDLEEAAQQAFASWDVLGIVSDPALAGGSGSKHELRRPTRGVGHASGGAEIEEDPAAPTDPNLVPLADPQRTGGSGSKQELRRPVRGVGHASGEAEIEEIPDPPTTGGPLSNPRRAGEKHELRRPSRGAGHTRQG